MRISWNKVAPSFRHSYHVRAGWCFSRHDPRGKRGTGNRETTRIGFVLLMWSTCDGEILVATSSTYRIETVLLALRFNTFYERKSVLKHNDIRRCFFMTLI